MGLNLMEKVKLLISVRDYQGVLAAALASEENPGIGVFLTKVGRYCPTRESKRLELEKLLVRIWQNEFERISSLTVPQVLIILTPAISYRTLCVCLVDQRQVVRDAARKLLSNLRITLRLTGQGKRRPA